ncbi:hypothetical protein [Nakamurella lactea]|uniref:hypothetical protein n=1 Tax=Nakamurella lactea TaxID=459515 RepID=UPI00041936DB|nr:hypothetical protein [Nakamurella lactea]
MPEPTPDQRHAGIAPAATPADQTERLRSLLAAQQRRFDALVSTVVHGLVLVTLVTLVAGLVLPFFVPRNGDGRSATLWQSLTEDAAPSIVPDAGGGWFVPIAATLLIIATTGSLWYGAKPGWALTVRRALAIAYLVGCVLGFLVMAAYDESPRPAGAPAGLVVLTAGAVLAVFTSYVRVLGDVPKYADGWIG